MSTTSGTNGSDRTLIEREFHEDMSLAGKYRGTSRMRAARARNYAAAVAMGYAA